MIVKHYWIMQSFWLFIPAGSVDIRKKNLKQDWFVLHVDLLSGT